MKKKGKRPNKGLGFFVYPFHNQTQLKRVRIRETDLKERKTCVQLSVQNRYYTMPDGKSIGYLKFPVIRYTSNQPNQNLDNNYTQILDQLK